MANLIGQRLGQYEIVSLLGKGGMATVYRARQESIDRDVAFKVIKPDLVGAGVFIDRFKREARTVASFSQPHILKVFDYGQFDDIVYLVMELMTGGSLADYLKTGSLSLETTTLMLEQISGALDYAHRRGVVHRDLKPQNVLLDEDQNAFLTDFGIAKVMNSSTLTQDGMAMGTPAYMPPEQWRGDEIDARADIYALGVMLFEMLTGRVPFQGDTPFNMMYKHMNDTPPELRTIKPDISPNIDRVIYKALAKDPKDRYETAALLTAAFKDAIQDHPMMATQERAPAEATAIVRTPTQPEIRKPPTATLELIPIQAARNNLPLLIGAVVLGLLAIGIGAFAVFMSSKNNPTPTPLVAVIPSQVAASQLTPTLLTPAPLSTTQGAVVAVPGANSATPSATSTLTMTTLPISTSAGNAGTAIAQVPTTSVPLTSVIIAPAVPTVIPVIQPTVTGKAAAPLSLETASSTPSATPTPVITTLAPPTSTHVPTATVPPAITVQIVTATSAPTLTPTHTVVAPTATHTNTQLPSATPTATYTNTPLPSATPTATFTNTPLPSATPNVPTNAASPTQTSAASATTPAGSVLAFLSKASNARPEIFVLSADGNVTQLTSTTDAYPPPLSWSHDHSQIAFVVRTNASQSVWVMNADGNNPTRYATGVYPAWSPDGQFIAYVGGQNNKNDIYVMNADGSNPHAVTNIGVRSVFVAWSPDSKQLVFISGGVWTVDAAGGKQPKRLNSDNKALDVAWSPDGKQMAVTSGAGIYVMNSDGTGQKPFAASGADPSWSADSKRLVYSSGGVIFSAAADGSDSKQLASGVQPVWSPDGKQIAYISSNALFVMNADGAHQVQLVANGASPVWAP